MLVLPVLLLLLLLLPLLPLVPLLPLLPQLSRPAKANRYLSAEPLARGPNAQPDHRPWRNA